MNTGLLAMLAMGAGIAFGFITSMGFYKRTKKNSWFVKKTMGVMDKILIVEALFLLVYTIVDMWIFYKIGSEPATLTTCVFGICGMENGVMGWIKTNKSNNETSKSNKEPLVDRVEPNDVGV